MEEVNFDFEIAHPCFDLMPVDLSLTAAIKTFTFNKPNDNQKIADFYGYAEYAGSGTFRIELAKFLSETIPGYEVLGLDLCILPGASFAINYLASQTTKITTEDNSIEYVLTGIFVVEDPTYRFAVPILEKMGASVISIPMDNDGMRVDLLEERLIEGLVVRCVYIIPINHNPVNVTLSEERRKKLINLSKIYKFIIISDEAYGLLSFSKQQFQLPLVSYDYDPFTVFSIGTFSKIYSPGMRTAWIHCKGKLKDQIIDSPVMISGGGFCTVSSAILENLLKTGQFKDHLEKINIFYEKNYNILNEGLRKYFPKEDIIRYREPTGGYFIWVEFINFPNQNTITKIYEKLKEINIKVVRGTENYINYFRLCFGSLSHEEIERGVYYLSKVIIEQYKVDGWKEENKK